VSAVWLLLVPAAATAAAAPVADQYLVLTMPGC
jgi:hypothetical protein